MKNILNVHLDDNELGHGRLGRVFRARLETDSPPLIAKLVIPRLTRLGDSLPYPRHLRTDDGVDALLSDLALEASIYERLCHLQGTVIPRCYGYGVNAYAKAACLILEDCGNPLEFPYRRLPQTDRDILYSHQVSLHKAGVSHGDVARRNFVKGPAGIRLIDFDRASFHPCPRFTTGDTPLPSNAAEHHHTSHAVGTCTELDKMVRWFGACSLEELTTTERRAFKPWDGPPWYN